MQSTMRTYGIDDLGRTIDVAVTITDPVAADKAPAMVVGNNVPDETFARIAQGGAVAGARMCRTFSSVGEGILPWNHPRRAVPAGVAEHHSWKDWPSDPAAGVKALLDGMPPRLVEAAPLLPELRPHGDAATGSDGLSLLLTYLHEGENNGLAPREWRRRHRLVHDVIRAHPNGHRVGYVPIQTLTWTEAASSPDKPKGEWDIFAWWAGVGDFAAVDCYVLSITTKPAAPALYRPPADFLRLPLELAAGVGRRLLVPEVGVIRQGTDPQDSGTLRAAWIRALVAYARAQGVAGMSWWDHYGSNSRDFRLTDSSSLAAWRDAIAGRI